MKPEKVLVLGASGAMARYMIPFLAENGCQVDGLALDKVESKYSNVKYYQGNAKELNVLREFLPKRYDAIVDFLTYPTSEIPFYLPQLLDNTDHYIFLSSGRVYDNLEKPVKETSPRLLDSSNDPLLLNSDDYCMYKARGENLLFSWKRKNWTIVRPSTTYSYLRYQLVTLEAANTVGRAFAGKKVVVPEQAKDKPASLSWGGDAGKMIGKLLFCDAALGEAFNVNSAESHTWGEIADYYKDICDLDAVWVDKEDYLKILNPDPYSLGTRWQLEYARLFDREVDNSKVLTVTGMKQNELMPLYDGLKMEIARTPKDYPWPNNQRMDDYLAAMK
jgi:nucleoside-diphosphate-sugar epimerase